MSAADVAELPFEPPVVFVVVPLAELAAVFVVAEPAVASVAEPLAVVEPAVVSVAEPLAVVEPAVVS
ncbi:MAG TPA: hypothetical protein DCO83_13830, partial [Mucilaginibacter sp.]|nr:hypothetical protein [Mucilaginibacter sp.]